MSRFFNSSLKGIVPYTPGEQPRDFKYIKLNTNESPFPPAPGVLSAAKREAELLNLYSDPTADALCGELARYYGVGKDEVAVGNGSDEVLAFAFHAFGERGFTGPLLSYGFYPVFAKFFSVPYRAVPMKEDLSIDIDALIGAGGAVVIANPNAQTGLYLEPSEIERLSSSVDAPVIVDEAYIDFGGISAVGLTRKYDNLLVTGTFSKSRNLAGARIGFAIGNRELIRDLNTLKFSFNPYNLNRISILAGAEALRDEGYFKECTEKIIRVREWFKKELSGLGFEVTDSMANFVLARSPSISGQALYLALREKGILVRYLGDEIIKDYVRITIGTLEEMQTLTERIKEILTEAK